MKVAEKISARSNLEGRRRPIDTHVGARIRLRRGLLGMSQVQLGDVLGLSYEQVQKYERGADRVNAWCLFEISQVLVVPISYFFDDIPEGMSGSPFSGPRGRRGSFDGIQVSFAADEDDSTLDRRGGNAAVQRVLPRKTADEAAGRRAAEGQAAECLIVVV